MAEAEGGDKLELGHQGSGDDCLGKMIRFGGYGAGAGFFWGVIEGSFLRPVSGSKTPMVFKSFKLCGRFSALYGCASLMYIGGVCLSAGLRDKDDYKNCSIGGMVASVPFGFYYQKLGVGLAYASFMAIIFGVHKFSTGRDVPDFKKFLSIYPRSDGARSLLDEDNGQNNHSQ